MNVRRTLTILAAGIIAPSLIAMGLVAPANSAVTSQAVKSVVKVGAKCTKVNAKAKVGATNFVCKRVNGKLVWAKVAVSADCKNARTQYATQNASYQDIIKQIDTARKALEGQTGTAADDLRRQLNDLENSVKPLATLVKQFKTLSDQICSIS
jgi:septal ring factor EnvC (AmiA/AmiB activator)